MKRLLSDEQHEFLVENNYGKSLLEITDLLNRTFGLNLTGTQVKGYRDRQKLKSGLTGRFEKGHTSPHKGKKKKLHPNVAKWCFKAGHQPPTYQPVGTEAVTVHGYTMVKVSDTGTRAERWKMKHVLIWEKEYGPVPEGMSVGFKNQNKKDFRLENLMCISKADHAVMNLKKRYAEDPHITENNLLITKIERKVRVLEDKK